MKTCFKCGETKAINAFYKHGRMADGHLGKCKECAKKDGRLHRTGQRRDSILAYDRARAKTESRKQKRLEYEKRKPWVAKVHSQFKQAVKTGRIKPWPVCAVPDCDVTKPHGHHPDYSQPLQVVWLCKSHHAQAHALTKELEQMSRTYINLVENKHGRSDKRNE